MIEKKDTLALVTGGAGFIGSHLCERLYKEGYRVISLDNYSTGSRKNHIGGVEYRTGHTKDIAVHVPERPAVIFHLGEYARTEKSFEDIEQVWDENVTGTFAVLEYWRRTHAKLIYAGSSTKFADQGDGKNQSPYAWTKASNTELIKNYAVWFGLTFSITYFYNVYGPREMMGSYGTLIRIMSELHENGEPLTVTSPGTQVRNFTHVYDIVEGIMLVGKKGKNDEYGIGADTAYSVLDVARMFGGEIIMMPERKGNRMTSSADNEKTKALGWKPAHTLPAYIEGLKAKMGNTRHSERRILVFSTTFLPDAGKAEEALTDLVEAMPHVHFDIITTYFSPSGRTHKNSYPNITLHRVGYGHRFDKFLIPILGARIARDLINKHTYMFAWSLFASYGALAAIVARVGKRLPLLITLADQRLGNIPWYLMWVLRLVIRKTDQVYADDTREAQHALSLARHTSLVKSIGSGDALANQVRFAYSTFLRKRTEI